MRRLQLIAVALLVAALAGFATTAAPVGAAVPKCNGKAETNPGSLAGTAGNDVIVGTNGPDTIDGLGGNGNDVVNGGTGNDTVCAFGPGDTLKGGSGSDRLDSASVGIGDPQHLDCGSGFDTYYHDGTDTHRRCEQPRF